MAPPIRLSFEMATDPRILGIAHVRAKELAREIVIDPPLPDTVIWLTREEAQSPETYHAAVELVGYTKVRLKPE